MRRLLVRDVQPLAEYLPVPAGLVQEVDKITVLKDVLDLLGGQEVLDVLGDPRGDASPFAEAFPNLHAPAPHLAAQQQVELVHIVAGGPPFTPVRRYSVPHLVLGDKHPQVFKLLSQFFDAKADKVVVDIHVRPMVKDVQ